LAYSPAAAHPVRSHTLHAAGRSKALDETDEAQAPSAKRGGASSPLWRLMPALVVAAGLGAGYALGLQRYFSLDFLAASSDALTAYAAAHPVLAPSLFFCVYVLAVAFSFPAA